MNYLESTLKKEANDEALFILSLYLFSLSLPYEEERFYDYIKRAAKNSKKNTNRLSILNNALEQNTEVENSIISNIVYKPGGLVSAVLTKPTGNISVVFKGTGNGEWIDNGEGLSGISEENTYCNYGTDGMPISCNTLITDFATDQQAEALNLFLKLCAVNKWDDKSNITVSGHSKGGNKAQFIAINSNIPNKCFSFNGQGFSPEAVNNFKKVSRDSFSYRQNRIYGFNAKNDYVNVFGEQLISQENIYCFKTSNGIHPLESMLDYNGEFQKQTNQGILSKYASGISNDIMNLPPQKRQYATLGIMNIFQRYFGKGDALNGDKVSFIKTITGIYIASKAVIKQFL